MGANSIIQPAVLMFIYFLRFTNDDKRYHTNGLNYKKQKMCPPSNQNQFLINV